MNECKIRTAEKSMKISYKNRSKKCFVKKDIMLWSKSLKKISCEPVNLKISLETSSPLVFFKYSHQIFLDSPCNLVSNEQPILPKHSI